MNSKDSEETGHFESLKSLRTTLDRLGDDVHSIENEVDPILEMTAIRGRRGECQLRPEAVAV